MGDILIFQRRGQAKKSRRILSTPVNEYHIFHHTLQKYPLRLYHTDHSSITLLGIFPRCFAYCDNVFSHFDVKLCIQSRLDLSYPIKPPGYGTAVKKLTRDANQNVSGFRIIRAQQ